MYGLYNRRKIAIAIGNKNKMGMKEDDIYLYNYDIFCAKLLSQNQIKKIYLLFTPWLNNWLGEYVKDKQVHREALFTETMQNYFAYLYILDLCLHHIVL